MTTLQVATTRHHHTETYTSSCGRGRGVKDLVESSYLQEDGRDGMGHKKCKQPNLNVNDQSHMGNTLKQGSADNYKCPQTAHENLPSETTGQHCLVFNFV